MPLNKKGKKIMVAMKKEYGSIRQNLDALGGSVSYPIGLSRFLFGSSPTSLMVGFALKKVEKSIKLTK